MHWIDFGIARSNLARWVIKNKNVGKPFRLRDICHYDGRENENVNELDPLMSIAMAHAVIADLVGRGLVVPNIDKNLVERYLPVFNTPDFEKKWSKLVFPRAWPGFIFISFWRGLKRRFWTALVWLLTIIAGAIAKNILFP